MKGDDSGDGGRDRPGREQGGSEPPAGSGAEPDETAGLVAAAEPAAEPAEEEQPVGPFCHSCGTHLRRPEDFGVSAEGIRINDYCASCYSAGMLTPPELAPPELLERTASYLSSELGVPPERARRMAGLALGNLLRQGAALASDWLTLTLRGGLAVLFGLLVLVWPALSLGLLVLLLGLFALAAGAFFLLRATRGSSVKPRWVMIGEGVLALAVAFAALALPGATAALLSFILAAWLAVTGVLDLVAAVRLRREVRGEGWLIAAGVLSLLVAALLLVFPEAGLVALVALLGIWSIFYGMVMIGLALRLRELILPALARVSPARQRRRAARQPA